jgi:membrane protein YdbS with pleckstrin-like domain
MPTTAILGGRGYNAGRIVARIAPFDCSTKDPSMKCPYCGADAVDGAAFCHACGVSLAAVAAEPPMPDDDVDATAGKQRFAAAIAPRGGDGDREEVLWEGRFSKLAMIGAWVAAAAFTLLALIVGFIAKFQSQGWWITLGTIAAVWIFLILRLLYMQYTVHYTLTNQRFVHERGLLWRQVDRIETIDIDDVTFQQGPVQRMLGVGTVQLHSSDQTTPEFQLIGIENVRDVAAKIDEARRKERRKRGVHIEAV